MHDEIVSLHDFVLPTSTALWYFRSVIDQEINSDPSVKVAELSKKYNVAPGTRGSTNLKVPFLVHTWERQRERLAEIALIGIIALYEIWCDQICDAFGRNELAIKLQFPTNPSVTQGVRFAITEMAHDSSAIIQNSIFPSLCSAKKYDLAHIDPLLKCFRYFKELRNCLLHRGRRCDGKMFGAQSDFIPIATKHGLGMGFVPLHSTYNLGEPVSISLHGVLGFTDVILRIITTIDAELSKTLVGESVIVQRLKALHSTPLLPRKLPRLFDTFGWKGVTITTDLRDFLRAQAVITRG